jgi:hypothetical protein
VTVVALGLHGVDGAEAGAPEHVLPMGRHLQVARVAARFADAPPVLTVIKHHTGRDLADQVLPDDAVRALGPDAAVAVFIGAAGDPAATQRVDLDLRPDVPGQVLSRVSAHRVHGNVGAIGYA